jgi:hypothetical protein
MPADRGATRPAVRGARPAKVSAPAKAAALAKRPRSRLAKAGTKTAGGATTGTGRPDGAARARSGRRTIATIGYQGAAMGGFLRTLRDAGIELLVDVRAVASSRRAGYSKSALAANLAGAGIGYLHLRGLGTPAAGRKAARAGRHAEMHAVFERHLATHEAQDELEALLEIVRSGTSACLLCFEADPAHCHRTLVARALGERMPVNVVDLMPD